MRDPGNEVEESHVSQTNRVFLSAVYNRTAVLVHVVVSRHVMHQARIQASTGLGAGYINFTGCSLLS